MAPNAGYANAGYAQNAGYPYYNGSRYVYLGEEEEEGAAAAEEESNDDGDRRRLEQDASFLI
jgi:hypothetical protein